MRKLRTPIPSQLSLAHYFKHGTIVRPCPVWRGEDSELCNAMAYPVVEAAIEVLRGLGYSCSRVWEHHDGRGPCGVRGGQQVRAGHRLAMLPVWERNGFGP